MATTSAGSVTIDRAYFETLVRRSNYRDGGLNPGILSSGQELSVVSKAEYENLLLIARHFTNLRRNLTNNGVSDEAIDILSQDDSASQSTSNPPAVYPIHNGAVSQNKGVRLNPYPPYNPNSQVDQRPYNRPQDGQRNGGYNGGYNSGSGRNANYYNQDWAEIDGTGDDFSASFSGDAPNQPGTGQASQRTYYEKICNRTLFFSGLPEGATYLDITNVVRGGLILELYLNPTKHVARVSFLLEEDATRFHNLCKRRDTYIKNKRVGVKWADRHFTLPPHIAGKIGTGATRNLVIRRCDQNHTEQSIRDDLEHIHNLEVFKVDFVGSNCHIKTNSVQNAMFARTCMMSRAKYKGCRIEWDVDECQQPLEEGHTTPPKPQPTTPTKKPGVPMQNRFATLRLDDDDNGRSDDKFDSSTEIAASSIVDVAA